MNTSIILLTSDFNIVRGGAGRYAEYWSDYYLSSERFCNVNFVLASDGIKGATNSSFLKIAHRSLFKPAIELKEFIHDRLAAGEKVILHANSAVEIYPYINLPIVKIVNVNDYLLASFYNFCISYLLEKRNKRIRKFASKMLLRA